MAEAIARRTLGNTFCVQSAGIEASDGAPAARHAIVVMEEKALNIRGHTARGIDKIDVSAFDVIVAMDPTIAESLRSRGTDPTKVIELNIPDPIGKSLDCYRATADAIALEIQRIFPTK